MIYNITDRVQEAWEYFDQQLDRNIEKISNLAEVEPERLVKINPMEFIERNPFQQIDGYHYQNIKDWIAATKTDENYLISPLDSIKETANQISYKANTQVDQTVRASKCELIPLPLDIALDFFERNHRQPKPKYRWATAICHGLVHKGTLAAVMMYDRSDGGVRGANRKYELVRLAIRKGYRIHGGASRLQKACEESLRGIGESKIYSYSNATINTGAVYQQLGFTDLGANAGQPFVIRRNNEITRLLNVRPHTKLSALAARGWIKVHLGGNKTWVKEL